MRRVLPAVLASLFLSSLSASPASGQTTGQSVTFAAKGGINLSNLTFSAEGTTVTPSWRTGFLVGGSIDVPLTKNFSLMPEFLVATRGGEVTMGGDGVAIKFLYLDVPVLFAYKLAPTGTVVPYVFGGPVFGILLTAKESDTFDGTTTDTDIKDDTTKADVGIALGGGVEIKRFLVEFRFTLGMMNLIKEPFLSESAKNKAFAILGGVRF
jgi:hypothetical protein